MAILPLLKTDLHISNGLFPSLFTIINNNNGDLIMLYYLELLVPSSGTGTGNCNIHRKLMA